MHATLKNSIKLKNYVSSICGWLACICICFLSGLIVFFFKMHTASTSIANIRTYYVGMWARWNEPINIYVIFEKFKQIPEENLFICGYINKVWKRFYYQFLQNIWCRILYRTAGSMTRTVLLYKQWASATHQYWSRHMERAHYWHSRCTWICEINLSNTNSHPCFLVELEHQQQVPLLALCIYHLTSILIYIRMLRSFFIFPLWYGSFSSVLVD